MSYNLLNVPPLIEWEALKKVDKLPAEFRVELPDDAMAPRAPRGTLVEFASSATAEPGDGVLVRDGRGRVHFREYRLTRTGWQAYAHNPAFPSFESGEDQLQIIAAKAAIKVPWARG